jgi:hypothetical protein
MVRKLPLLILLVAALLAAEPLLHQHPLDGPTSNRAVGVCVICAAGVTRLPRVAPTIIAPQIVVYALVASVTVLVTKTVATSLPSRAPPAL